MLEIKNLHVRRPGFELGPLSFSIKEGEYFVLLGPSGAGKTTLLEWITGFVDAAAGTLLLDGRDLTALPPQRRGLGIVYQDSALFPTLSVRENLGFALKMQNWEKPRIVARVEELARKLHLDHRLDASVREISGGEQRRVALGRALAAGCRVLLLDEPLTGLDPALRREMRCELRALQQELGLIVLHITHLVGEARALGDRLSVLLDGRILQSGTYDALANEPQDAAVARALLIPNFLSGTADLAAGGIRLEGGALFPAPVKAAGPVRLRVRNIALSRNRPTGRAVEGWYAGEDIGESGAFEALVRLESTSMREATVLHARFSNGAARGTVRPGEKIWIDLSGADWHLY